MESFQTSQQPQIQQTGLINSQLEETFYKKKVVSYEKEEGDHTSTAIGLALCAGLLIAMGTFIAVSPDSSLVTPNVDNIWHNANFVRTIITVPTVFAAVAGAIMSLKNIFSSIKIEDRIRLIKEQLELYKEKTEQSNSRSMGGV